MAVEFNPEKHVLGKLCKHGHEYGTSGRSMRLKSTGTCVICDSIRYLKYRQSHKEQARAYRNKYVQSHREQDRARHKRYWQVHREQIIAGAARRAAQLGDGYVIRRIVDTYELGIPPTQIPQELIELKRAQLKSYRASQAYKKGDYNHEKINSTKSRGNR